MREKNKSNLEREGLYANAETEVKKTMGKNNGGEGGSGVPGYSKIRLTYDVTPGIKKPRGFGGACAPEKN